jgi:hypothetical protein
MRARQWLGVGILWGTAVPAAALPAVQTGLVGIARLQTARVSVVNLAAANPEAPPDPCVLSLSFQDHAGTTFRDGTGAPLVERASLDPGASASLELPGALALAGSTAARRLIRATVDVNPGPPELPPSPCAEIATTLEVYDGLTGRTEVVVDPSPPSPEPGPPQIPLGLLGLARFQLARLNVIHLPADSSLPPSPCSVSLAFLRSDGSPFLDHGGDPIAAQARLDAGQSAALDLPASIAFGQGSGPRRSFRGLVEVAPGPPDLPPNPCVDARVTLEIVDRLTARTSVLMDASVVSRRVR